LRQHASPELDGVIHAAQDIGVGVLDGVETVSGTERIGVVLVAARQVVDARPAIERVGVIEAVNGGRLVLRIQNLDDLVPGIAAAVGEPEAVDAVEPELSEQAVAGSELILDGELVTAALDRDLQVVGIALPGKDQIRPRYADAASPGRWSC
jgi:hypothetical protein